MKKLENESYLMAKVAGISLIIMFLAAMVAEVYVRQSLIKIDDLEQTSQNIYANVSRFRLGIVCFIVIVICDILATWSLYLYFKSIFPSISLLAALTRLIYTAIFGVAVFYLVFGFRVLTQHKNLLPTNDFMQYFILFDDFWVFSLLFFGCHLLLIGILAFRMRTIPRVICIMLVIAGIMYFVNSFCKLLDSNYDTYATFFTIVLALTGIMGELGLAIWLVWKSSKSTF